MLINRNLFYILSAIFILGCSSSPKYISPDLETTSYRDLLMLNSKWQESIQNINGNARITLDTPQYSGNFNADVIMSGKDSLLISVTGPLGIRVGKVFISRNRFIFYNQVMNQFYTGRKDNFKGRNFLQFPVEIGQLRDLLLAQDKFDVLKKEEFTIRDQMYYLSAVNGKLSYHIWFDPAIGLIKKIEYLNDGQMLFSKEYNQFEIFNKVYFPRVINFIKISDKNETQGISIYFNDLTINEPIDSEVFDIKVSDSAEQIDLSL
jgi:hypothetical protein